MGLKGKVRLKPLPLSQSSPASSPMRLVDPYAVPDDFLTPGGFDVVPGVSPGAIGARATGDVVLAPVYRTDIVVAMPTVAVVLAAAEVQRVRATPTLDAVGATVAVDGVALRGTYEGVGSVIALDQCGQGHAREHEDHHADERDEYTRSLHLGASLSRLLLQRSSLYAALSGV